MKIEAAKIRSWVERIEVLLTQRKDINEDIRDIFTEIKRGDHDAKAIRKLIQRRGEDPFELAEQDTLLAAYTDAVAGKIKALEAIERGASTREAAQAGSISTGAVSALARDARVHNSRELNEKRADEPTSVRGDEESAASNTASASSPPPVAEYVFPYSQAELEAEYPGITAPDRDPSLPPDLAAEAERLGLTAVVRDLELRRAAEAELDDLTIPAHLRRTAA